jgi:Fe-S cluster biogenesis protein NfuA
MAVYDDKLIVGGQISNAGGQFVQNLVQWNGTEWSQVGFGRSSTVRALAVLDGHLYVGGSFFSPESYIARWDGSLFSAVGSGMNSSVGSLLVANGTLYAGGRFTFAGEVAAKHIGQWDGTEWQPLGDGVDLFVSTIATWGGHVVVGGERATSPNVVTPYLVHWDGETWSEAGPGVNGQVDALLAIEDALYAGGEFTTASGQVAAYVAQLGLQIGGPSRIVGIEVAGGSVALRFAGAPRAAYQVVRSPNLGPSQEWLVVTVAPILADDLGAFEFEDVAPLPGAAYYRIEEVAPPTRTSRTKPEHEHPLEWHSTTTVPAPSLTTR